MSGPRLTWVELTTDPDEDCMKEVAHLDDVKHVAVVRVVTELFCEKCIHAFSPFQIIYLFQQVKTGRGERGTTLTHTNYGFGEPWLFLGAPAVLKRVETVHGRRERVEKANKKPAGAYANDYDINVQVNRDMLLSLKRSEEI